MTQESAVQFATNSRIHIGLAVKSFERSVNFYRTLFGQGPAKSRPHYAKFELAEPPINLSLNEFVGETGPVNSVAHFGIQVKSIAVVKEVADRLKANGEQINVEDSVTCCYAVQNKIWAIDPDGNKWEVYVVINNDADQHEPNSGQCCVGTTSGIELGVFGRTALEASATANAGSSCCGRSESTTCC